MSLRSSLVDYELNEVERCGEEEKREERDEDLRKFLRSNEEYCTASTLCFASRASKLTELFT